VAGEGRPGVALVAVGGYGRRQLCPGSDLDVVLVHRGLDLADLRELADRLWYPLWDTGVRVDHSVRSLREALRLADGELEVATGLLDGRCVWGDEGLVAELVAGVAEQWRRSARRRLGELADAVAARQASAGEVAFLLEPDLKVGRGGLRDAAALRAAAAGSPVLPPLDAVDAAADLLLAVRVELHRRTGRRGDRLVLEEQDGVADALGCADADVLMATVATAARTIARAGDDGWRRVRSWIDGPKGRQGTADRPLGAGLALRDGEVVLVGAGGPGAPQPDPAEDRSLTWRAAVVSAETGAPLARATLGRLAAAQPVQDGSWTPSMRQALVALLATGHAAVGVFEELDEAQVLTRLLPEWSAVRNRPQRNAFHRFTVDRHLCEAAAEAASLARRVARPDLLLLGAWLHDMGKGFPGDHTVVGMGVVGRIARRMGLPSEDRATLVALVEHHLLLPDVATRRDLHDPGVIESVAASVATAERLELLAALAEADGRATGPAAWGPWKAGLVEELVTRVGRVLAGERPPTPAPPFERAMAATSPAVRREVAGALAARRLAVLVTPGDCQSVAVVAPDRPGMLALVAGVLALHRVVVLSAVCASARGGMVVDVFTVEHELGGALEPGQLEADLGLALDGRLPVGARVAERSAAYAGRRRRRSATPAAGRVLLSAADGATIVEVRAPDDVGLLHRVAVAFAECGLDVSGAKVATLGHEVVDTFTVTAAGGPVAPERWPEVGAAVLAQVDAASNPG